MRTRANRVGEPHCLSGLCCLRAEVDHFAVAEVDDIDRPAEGFGGVSGYRGDAPVVVAHQLQGEVRRVVIPVRLQHDPAVVVAGDADGCRAVEVVGRGKEATLSQDRTFEGNGGTKERHPMEKKEGVQLLVPRAAEIQVHSTRVAGDLSQHN